MTNPLFEPQREKSGSGTMAKYSYQYHWALERAIIEHEKRTEYAIFIEFHEDVVLSNSTNKETAKFEFNQVKTNENPFTARSLTKRGKTKDKLFKKSIIGKILDSTLQKSYTDKILSINIVSASGFSLKLKDPKLKFEKIAVNDLDSGELQSIKDFLSDELEGNELPSNLNFVIPQLKEINHQTVVIGKISELISAMFPGSRWDSTNVYRSLFDDLLRKGQNSFDYQNWDDAIAKKALTSQQVTETVNAHTSHRDDGVFETRFQAIVYELGYSTIKCKNVRRGFDRHKNKMIGSRSQRQISYSQMIRKSIEANLPAIDENLAALIQLVSIDIIANSGGETKDENEMAGEIIYEFIASD